MPTRLLALCAFLSTAFLTWFFTSHLFSASLDEGIYLNGAHRILQGQVPYRDFFAFTGPMIYWAGALAEWLGGPVIPTLRIVTAIAIGMTAIGAFQLARFVGGRPAAITGTLIWFSLTLELSHRLHLNHRWLSTGLMSLAAVFLFHSPRPTRLQLYAAGALVSLAAWTTQSYAIALLLLLLYFLIVDRRAALDFAVGAAGAGIVPLTVLAIQGALGLFVQNMLWVTVNYTEANKAVYGYAFNEVPLRFQFHLKSAVWLIPAVLGLLVGLRIWRKDKGLDLVLVYAAAFFLTSYGKWDASQLLFINAPFIAIAAGLLFRFLPERLEPVTSALLSVPSAFIILNMWGLGGTMTPYASRAGNLIGTEKDVAAMQRIEAEIPAGATAFIFPYLTELYPLLHVQNPTRYEYLQPGMMNERDEELALADLRRQPPSFIYWHGLADAEVLKIWPNTNRARLHFKSIETWIRANYSPGQEIYDSQFLGQVWTRKQ